MTATSRAAIFRFTPLGNREAIDPLLADRVQSAQNGFRRITLRLVPNSDEKESTITLETFLAGPIELKSNINLYLDAGSVLKAHPDESIYNMSAFKDNRGEGMMWLHCKDIENLSITGTGTIHGNGIAFMGKELSDSYELKPLKDPTFDPRPHVLTLIGVKRLVIRDVTIREGAYWTVHLIGCQDAVIDGISLLNNVKIRNGDGIDVDHSRNVRINNCHITSGDDCICLKNRREWEEYGACTHVCNIYKP